jgi:hypothetical protein
MDNALRVDVAKTFEYLTEDVPYLGGIAEQGAFIDQISQRSFTVVHLNVKILWRL